jgi:hypothetical protein
LSDDLPTARSMLRQDAYLCLLSLKVSKPWR